MGLPGTIDTSVYDGLRDVLNRHPKVTTVGFEPDSISKEYIRASIAPDRVEPPTTRSGVAVSTRNGILSNPLRGPEHRFQLWVAPRRGSSGPRFGTVSVRTPKHRGIRSDTRRIHKICSDRDSVDCASSVVQNDDSSVYVE
ncbi:MAG: hypothetical protein J07HQW2_01650 [Haloquadratum walsbyi J07HQW2]|uniref:Uncharacterized protein n=1 Tax=Haloquadratum walsbyi J07HQW2 TaxID=1238425 RepID=U1PS55_9EURY|nr:MAG: hypothetical protein J07HQW2_01650 [Haloquadratum walsbyi J07HQW2]